MPDDDDDARPEPTARERALRRDRPLVQRAIVSDALMDPAERERIGFDPSPDAPIPVVVELNLRHRDGLAGAAEQFLDHYRTTLPGAPGPDRVADTYFRCELTQAATSCAWSRPTSARRTRRCRPSTGSGPTSRSTR
jgi:hypothetical protein